MDKLTIDIIATEKLANICTRECSSCKERVYCKKLCGHNSPIGHLKILSQIREVKNSEHLR